MRIALMVLRLFWVAPYYVLRIWWCGISKKISFPQAFDYIKMVTKKANRAGASRTNYYRPIRYSNLYLLQKNI